ncbi:MAG: ShlB/FhaC/HecB family hemolysin secretion/activation protein [Syntrophaceae bacterium]|nr:ShlB/FhaC/HecB family hemolysin secretion/activation protein [Syntrophaceae bacterium]
MKRLIAGTLCLMGFMFCWSIMAPAADVPGTFLPGQIEKQFKPEPQMRAAQPDRIGVPEVDQPVPPEANDIRFTLTRITITGTTVYSESALLAPYQKLLNTEVSLAEMYRIASALTAKYRNDGYILSRVIVPAQSIENGEVRLQAIEGYVATVTVEGVKGDRRKLVERYAEKIKQSRPLRNNIMERYLLLMNDLPGAFARATIKSSPTEPGAADMVVQFTQQKIQGGLAADNRGGEAQGPERLSGDISFNSVLGLQESTTLRVVSSGDEKLKYASLVHEENIGPNGGTLNFYVDVVDSEPEEMLFIPLNLETSSETYTLTYMYPLIRSRAQNLSLRGSFFAHNGDTEIFGVDDTRDRIRGVRIGATYDLADAWQGVTLLDIEFSQGIDGLGSSDNGDMMLSRANGRVDFTKVVLYAARLQSLTPRFSVLAALNAQYAWCDLLSSELFSFGGEQFGRGYDPSEMVGDNGIAGKLELRFTDSLPFGFTNVYTLYGFYDIGVVYQRSPGSGFDHSASAASAGMGLRLGLGQYVSCYAEVAKPLTRDVYAEENRHARLYGGVSFRF